MITLQELITRGRFVLGGAPSRLAVFDAVDGRRTAQQIAVSLGRHVNNVNRDLSLLRDAGLIQQRGGQENAEIRNGITIFEKVPLARTVSLKYFEPVADRPNQSAVEHRRRNPGRRAASVLSVPNENEILEIARRGEDQRYEFKAPGVDVGKISREIGAMLNTSLGGIVFYGIDDDGNILGTDVTRQKLDQPLQNSIKNTISPAATVQMHSVAVMGSQVLVIIVPPWNRTSVYQYAEKILIRKGTNVFAAKPEEVQALHRGQTVI